MSKTPTLSQLKLEAKKLGLKGYTKLSKSELQQAVGNARKKKAKKLKLLTSFDSIPTPTTVEEASTTFGTLTKGQTRKIRKLLRRKGRNDLAAARREVSV